MGNSLAPKKDPNAIQRAVLITTWFTPFDLKLLWNNVNNPEEAK